jgi:hypothetical protein
MADDQNSEARFAIVIPGGRIARLPLDVLESYVDPTARLCHPYPPPTPEGTEADDVVAHHLAADLATGTSDWHTDWEYGDCTFTDSTGFAQQILGWHRHPLGTEYTEIYDGR